MYEEIFNINNVALEKEFKQFKQIQGIIYLFFVLLGLLIIISIIYLVNFIGFFSIPIGIILFSIFAYILNNWTPLQYWETSLHKRISEERIKQVNFKDNPYFIIYEYEQAAIIDHHIIITKYMDKNFLNDLIQEQKQHTIKFELKR